SMSNAQPVKDSSILASNVLPNKHRYVIYQDPKNFIYYNYWDGSRWIANSFTMNLPRATDNAFVSLTIGQEIYVFYIDLTDAQIGVIWGHDKAWQQQKLPSSHPPKPSSPLTGIVMNSTPHIFFLDANGSLQLLELLLGPSNSPQYVNISERVGTSNM